MIRFFAFLALATAFCFVAPAIGSATPTEGGAKDFIESVSNEALTTLAGKGDVTEEEAREAFRALLVKAFDMNAIARFTLGRYWRQADKKQQEEFRQVLEQLIVATYANRLREYQGKGFDITGAQEVSKKDTAVNMLIYPGGKKDQAVDLVWRVREIDGQLKIIDLSVEGVSMSITHRNDFSSVIQRNGGQVQALIDSLNEKQALE